METDPLILMKWHSFYHRNYIQLKEIHCEYKYWAQAHVRDDNEDFIFNVLHLPRKTLLELQHLLNELLHFQIISFPTIFQLHISQTNWCCEILMNSQRKKNHSMTKVRVLNTKFLWKILKTNPTTSYREESAHFWWKFETYF